MSDDDESVSSDMDISTFPPPFDVFHRQIIFPDTGRFETQYPFLAAVEMKNPSMVVDERLAFWANSHNYQLCAMIGEGSFGKVFKAVHRTSNSVVAVKFIFKVDELESLQQEVEIQQRLKHPNIVRMLDSFGNENEIALVMEFVPRSLKEVIERDGMMSEVRTRTIICHLISALHYLHGKKILHRDLKPPNVLLDHNDVAKLCDFGLARLMLTGTQVLTQASLKGTPLYMAPEVINSPVIPPTYNHNADLWSLGCIAYHLLCGKPPYDTKCLMHLVQMMKEKQIVWPSTVSPVCRNFLEQLLRKNPLKRLTWPNLLDHQFVKNKVFIASQHGDSDISSEMNDIVFPLNSMKIKEEEINSDSSSSHDLTSIEETTEEEDLRSSQSSWCSETCQELDVCSNQTNITNNNINTHDFMSEEWIAFIRQSASEVISGNLSSMNQKSFILVVLSSIKSSNVSSKLLHYVVTLLAIPFVTPSIEQQDKDSITQIYIDTKVIPCLMHAFSKAFKSTRSCVSPVPPDLISAQELDSLEAVLLLVEGLSLDRPIECVKQFADCVKTLGTVPIIQKCLSLSHGNTRLVANTLAVLILTLIYLPYNISLLIEIVFGKQLEGRIPNVELHKLLRNNEEASVRERTCILLLHMTRLSPYSFLDVWHQTLTNDIEFLKKDPCPNVVQAAIFASEILKKTDFYQVEVEIEQSKQCEESKKTEEKCEESKETEEKCEESKQCEESNGCEEKCEESKQCEESNGCEESKQCEGSNGCEESKGFEVNFEEIEECEGIRHCKKCEEEKKQCNNCKQIEYLEYFTEEGKLVDVPHFGKVLV